MVNECFHIGSLTINSDIAQSTTERFLAASFLFMKQTLKIELSIRCSSPWTSVKIKFFNQTRDKRVFICKLHSNDTPKIYSQQDLLMMLARADAVSCLYNLLTVGSCVSYFHCRLAYRPYNLWMLILLGTCTSKNAYSLSQFKIFIPAFHHC